jgi:hypothetical protein
MKKKTYIFSLLRRRHIALRIDSILVTLVWGTIFYLFGFRCFDKEDLMASVCFILSIAVNGVLVLANFWSVAWNEFCAFATIGED